MICLRTPFPDGGAGEGQFEARRAAPSGDNVFLRSVEQRADFGQPFLVEIGPAAVIADWLRECGCLRCTADVVTAELDRPGRERSAIRRLTAGLLETAGWWP